VAYGGCGGCGGCGGLVTLLNFLTTILRQCASNTPPPPPPIAKGYFALLGRQG